MALDICFYLQPTNQWFPDYIASDSFKPSELYKEQQENGEISSREPISLRRVLKAPMVEQTAVRYMLLSGRVTFTGCHMRLENLQRTATNHTQQRAQCKVLVKLLS
ncbi:hypothetical protein CSKR_108921 [Clonorchis sinensis]|uniref:Uncharacterized protein n=2 Tax=Clonorchis sinensis TaxID=79923 RepID=A0A3R7ELP7_CLOSI|nr:hypothetical protein CSKR_108921 [Clonorchis sinensis]